MLFGALVVSLLSFLDFKSSKMRLEHQLGERLKSISSTGSLLIDTEIHSNIVVGYISGEKNLHQSDDFKKIQLILKKIKKTNNLASDVYTLIEPEWDKGKMIFITMASDKTYIGNTLPVSEHVKKVYQSKKTIFTSMYKDSEGQWISSITPLIDNEGNVVAVFQVDYNASIEVRDAVAEVLKDFWLNISLALSLSFALSFLIGSFVIKPLKKIGEEASQIFKSNFEITISGESVRGEIGVLARSFNSIIAEIRNYTQNLEEIIDERLGEIKTLQGQLIRQAYNEGQAYSQGQAENAVNILHNMGNLITPALTRISLEDDLESLELTFKVVKGISLQLQKIEPFLDDTAPVKQSINQVIETLDELKSEVEENARFVQANKDAIKDIIEKVANVIFAQQKYANFGDKTAAKSSLLEIVSDVLTMQEPEALQKEINIVRGFQTNPFVAVEKNRFSNVIVNIIVNSIEAIEERGRNDSSYSEKELRVTVLEDREKNIATLIVEDNGIGFSEKDASKIFDFGFSTKGRTPGFGLHNCANLIHSYKGVLEIYSLGLNQGAKIVMSLPSVEASSE